MRAVLVAGLLRLLAPAAAPAQLPLPPGGGGGGGGEAQPPPPPPAVAPGQPGDARTNAGGDTAQRGATGAPSIAPPLYDASSTLVALEAATGRELWRAESRARRAAGRSPPATWSFPHDDPGVALAAADGRPGAGR
ncbi:MAG TPA: hypothetical protein VHF89_18285 [Solirubrobacteraceae bacterium]|nr:hypothetical protein [Solirubrobacteraceae bacterium]